MGIRVVTLKVRERYGLQKICHKTIASAKNPHLGVQLALKSSSASMATLSRAPWCFIRPVSRWPQRGGRFQSFPPRTPAHDRQGHALSGCYERPFGPCCILVNCSKPMHVHAHAHIYMHTHIHILYICVHTYIHIHRLSDTCRRATPYVPATCSDLKITKL